MGGEGYLAVFKLFDATIGNSHPVCIAGKIFENLFRALDRVANADYPVFGIQHVRELAICSAFKFNRTGIAFIFQALHELTPKDP